MFGRAEIPLHSIDRHKNFSESSTLGRKVPDISVGPSRPFTPRVPTSTKTNEMCGHVLRTAAKQECYWIPGCQ